MSTRVVRYQGSWTNYVHVGSSLCADLSPDGVLIVSSATHGQVLVRERVTGTVISRMNGHWNSVGWIRWSPSQESVLSSCVDRTARLWDPSTGAQRLLLEHPAAVLAGEYLTIDSAVTACADGRLRTWDLSTGKMLSEFDVGIGPLHAVMPSHKGNRLAASNANSLAVMALDGTQLRTWQGGIGSARRPKWSPDDKSILVPCNEGLIEFESNTLAEQRRYVAQGTAVQSVAWSPSGSEIAIGLGSGVVTIVAADTFNPGVTCNAHSAFVWDVKWHASGTILTVGVDGAVCSWDQQKLTELSRIGAFSRGISSAEWSPRADRIVTSSADGIFVIWDVQRRRAQVEHKAHPIWIRSIRWHPVEDRFLTASQDGSVAIWRAPSGSDSIDELTRIDLGIGPLWEGAWTPAGEIACVSEQGQLGVLNLSHPEVRRTVVIEADSWLRGLAWDPRDKYCVVTSMSGWVEARSTSGPAYAKLWRANFSSPCFACSASPDGEQIAVGLGSGAIVLLSRRGQLIAQLTGHDSEVWSVGFSRDGQRLVSAGADGSVRLWNVPDREHLKTFQLTTSCVSARFSPGGLVLFGSSGAWIIDPNRSEPEPGKVSTTLTDSPIAILDGPAEIDLLQRDALVEELAFFLHRTAEQSRQAAIDLDATQDAFLLHIGGRWGSGKTTLVRQVAERVTFTPRSKADSSESSADARRWTIVEFSAWSNAGLGPAWWSLATSMRRAILGDKGWIKRRLFAWREMNWRFPNLLLRIVLVLMLFVAVGSGLIIWRHIESGGGVSPPPTSQATQPSGSPSANSSNDTGSSLETGTTVVANLFTVGVPLLGALGAVFGLIRSARARWRWPRTGPTSVDLETDSTFGDLPRQYIGWLRAQTSRDLLLIVDDLDRCPAEYVVEMLTALHLVSRGTRIAGESVRASQRHALAIVVLGDGDWLEQSIESSAGIDISNGMQSAVRRRYGAAYLEKIFIASIQLPALLESQRLDLVRGGGATTRAQAAVNVHPAQHDAVVIYMPNEGDHHTAISSPHTPGLKTLPLQSVTQGVRANLEVMHGTIEERMKDLAQLAAIETQLIEDYAGLMDTTARGVKRTLVAFWINRAIAHSLPCEPPLTDEEVMRWTILVLRWPTLVQRLHSEESGEWTRTARQDLGREAAEFDKAIAGLNMDRVAGAMLP